MAEPALAEIADIGMPGVRRPHFQPVLKQAEDGFVRISAVVRWDPE